MATEKLFTVAGVTNSQGTVKVRFGNDLISRIKIFSKGDTQVRLIELPNAMSKLEALQYLSTHDEYQDRESSFVIQSKLQEKSKAAKRGEVKVAGTKKVAKTETTKETV
jgi:ribosomal protein L35AE/L33A